MSVTWVQRWAGQIRVRFCFNQFVSRTYHTSTGIPQGSSLFLCVFGVYVADILQPHYCYTPAVSCVVVSYTDDKVIVVVADTQARVLNVLLVAKVIAYCNKVAGERGMGFSRLKTNWIEFGSAV